ncbi:MAG: CDP-diacylglycerol--glycerol-3-phosphate 3-phosphatidyltransferase [Clostridia bacterium]|nr:CDP-diacylglycerol--glycerol-3-phosphate 3-phosphatidyltransferase [Clostridia bacterium]
MNLPNKLSLLRVFLVPIFMVFYLCNFGLGIWRFVIAAVIYMAAGFTDFLDGNIARKYGLVTNLGKFLDPLADKFMVMTSLLCLCYMSAINAVNGNDKIYGACLVVASAIVIFRELAITSMRLVAASTDGSVIAAAYLGKLKTVTQMVFTSFAIIEPAFYGFGISFINNHVLSYVLMALMTIMTVWSGIDYLKSYWKYIKE